MSTHTRTVYAREAVYYVIIIPYSRSYSYLVLRMREWISLHVCACVCNFFFLRSIFVLRIYIMFWSKQFSLQKIERAFRLCHADMVSVCVFPSLKYFPVLSCFIHIHITSYLIIFYECLNVICLFLIKYLGEL